MRTLLAFSLIAVTLSSLPARAGSLAGVTLPDSASVGGKTLTLNGLGLRSKLFIKIYVGGLYLGTKSSDAAAILAADAPKKLVLHFLYAPSKGQMTDALHEGFEANAPAYFAQHRAEADRFLAAVDGMGKGEEMTLTYVPGTGTTLAIRGKDVVTLTGADFMRAVFSIWLGSKPPTADLKKGLLGQS